MLLIGKSSPCGGSEYSSLALGIVLYHMSDAIYYNRKYNVLSASLNKYFQGTIVCFRNEGKHFFTDAIDTKTIICVMTQ